MTIGYSLTVPAQDVNGWTLWPTAEQTYYISSSSGNDASDGLSVGTAKATIAAGWALLRSGHGDHLLLKCGDTWTEVLPHWSGNGGGASRTSPMLIGSYGSGARPILRPTYTQLISNGNVLDFAGGGGVPDGGFAHIWLMDLDIYPSFRDPSSPDYDATNGPGANAAGLGADMPLTDMHVENCRFRTCTGGIGIQGSETQSVSDIRIRRCQVLDSWAAVQRSQGIYISDASQLLIDSNVVDHNGWNTTGSGGDRTTQNHDIYLSAENVDLANVSIVNNIVTNASNIGIHFADFAMAVTDVLVTGNLVADNPNGFTAGNSNTSNFLISGNVFTETGGDPGNGPQSVDMRIGGVSTFQITGNYQINSPSQGGSSENLGLILGNGSTATNITYTGNVIHGRAFSSDGDAQGISNTATSSSGLTLTPNDVSGAAWANSLAAYDTSIGGAGTSADFIAGARAIYKATWNMAYTAGGAIAWMTTVGYEQIRAHWAVVDWAPQHWFPQHWVMLVESIDANAPRSCLSGTFAPLVGFTGTFAVGEAESGTFDLVVTMLGTWDTCGD